MQVVRSVMASAACGMLVIINKDPTLLIFKNQYLYDYKYVVYARFPLNAPTPNRKPRAIALHLRN